jgi:hypothetical protein
MSIISLTGERCVATRGDWTFTFVPGSPGFLRVTDGGPVISYRIDDLPLHTAYLLVDEMGDSTNLAIYGMTSNLLDLSPGVFPGDVPRLRPWKGTTETATQPPPAQRSAQKRTTSGRGATFDELKRKNDASKAAQAWITPRIQNYRPPTW